MLDLKDDTHPEKREQKTRPLTKLEKEQGLVIVLAFVVWLPVYLIWVRPEFNALVFKYIDSYPAFLHLVPIIGVPVGVGLAYAWLARAWGRNE